MRNEKYSTLTNKYWEIIELTMALLNIFFIQYFIMF